jgi:dTDP-4-amino-4,6-dideoxygalactose transaminase
MSVPASVRHGAREVIFESYPVVGYNYRMTDIQAAIGREQLRRLPEIVRRRRALAQRYLARLAEIPGIGLPQEPAWARSNWQSFCVRLPRGSDQRRVMQRMLDRGVSTRRGIMCIHREPAYADLELRWPLPHSEAAQESAIILPLFPQMTDALQDRVIGVLREACASS